jgi:hypothetical protein
MKRTGRLMGIVVLLAAAVAAADLNGKWKGTLQSPDGPVELVFDFAVKGEALTGTVQTPGSKDAAKIDEGKVQGDTTSFSFITQYQGSPLKLLCKTQPAEGGLKVQMGTEDGGWGTEFLVKKSS